METIACCSDHAGFELKAELMVYLRSKGYDVKDFGTFSTDSCDYPDYAHPMAFAIERGEFERGVAVCGTGNGVNITLNKHQGIRAGLAWTTEIARLIKQHNNANVCVLPGRFVTTEEARAIVDAYLDTPFEGGRHQLRIDKISVG